MDLDGPIRRHHDRLPAMELCGLHTIDRTRLWERSADRNAKCRNSIKVCTDVITIRYRAQNGNFSKTIPFMPNRMTTGLNWLALSNGENLSMCSTRTAQSTERSFVSQYSVALGENSTARSWPVEKPYGGSHSVNHTRSRQRHTAICTPFLNSVRK